MKKYQQIYVLSDIHGYLEGLREADLVCTTQQPLFILGDLFDHIFGNEQEIIDLMLKMISEKRCYFIVGNHDIVIYYALKRASNNDELLANLRRDKNLNKFKIFETLFSKQFYKQFLNLRTTVLNMDASTDQKLSFYYEQITSLCQKPESNDYYNKLQKLFAESKDYIDIEVGGASLFLSHSGSKTDPSSRDTARETYKLDQDYDYGIIGHLTIPAVEKMIEEEGDMIAYSNFSINPKLSKLELVGNYMYNQYSKVIMVDDGTHCNLLIVRGV